MNKSLLTCHLMVFILPMVICSCSSDNDDEPKDKYLSEVIVREHEYKFGVPNTYGELYESYTYDSKGNLLKEKTNYYNAVIHGRISHENTYTYDNANHIIERNEYSLSLLDFKYFYTYNSIDSVSAMKVYDDEGDLYETWTYDYDNARKLIKATVVQNWLSNNYGYIHNYTYSGHDVTDKTYNIKDGTLFGITFDEYDSYGNLTSNTWTNGTTGKKVQQKGIAYEYNSKGQIAKRTSWAMSPKDLTYETYAYNEDGILQKNHVSYSNKTDESDLIYECVYK